MSHLTKPYKFSAKDKQVIAGYLRGELSQLATANHFQVVRQHIPTITNTIFRHLVSTDKINIRSLINEY